MTLVWGMAAISASYVAAVGWRPLGALRWLFVAKSGLFLTLSILAGIDTMRSEVLWDTCIPTWIQTMDTRGRMDVLEAESCVTIHWLPESLRWINQ